MLIKKSSSLIVITILIMLSGCTWINNLKNLSQGWISIEDKPILSNGTGLHIRIKDRFIWENANEAIELGQQIQKSLQISIDEKLIPREKMFFINGLQFPQDVFDKNGKRLGSYHDSTDVYVPQLNLIEGPHIGSIKVMSISGTTYTYSWEFTVKHE